VIFSVSLWPLSAGERTAHAIAEAVDAIDTSGLSYRLTAMATLIEGEWGPVMELVGRCQQRMQRGYGRTFCQISIDDDPHAKVGEMEHNIAAVEEILGRPLRR
jgi:uncharacterized protein YqgV (UPF0045/DUF77 family)